MEIIPWCVAKHFDKEEYYDKREKYRHHFINNFGFKIPKIVKLFKTLKAFANHNYHSHCGYGEIDLFFNSFDYSKNNLALCEGNIYNSDKMVCLQSWWRFTREIKRILNIANTSKFHRINLSYVSALLNDFDDILELSKNRYNFHYFKTSLVVEDRISFTDPLIRYFARCKNYKGLRFSFDKCYYCEKIRNSISILVLFREYEPNCLLGKDFLPLDMFRLIFNNINSEIINYLI